MIFSSYRNFAKNNLLQLKGEPETNSKLSIDLFVVLRGVHRDLLKFIGTSSVVLLVSLCTNVQIATAQQCAENLAGSCIALLDHLGSDHCLEVGKTYVKDGDKWHMTRNHSVLPRGTTIDLFTVVDASGRDSTYGAIFVGVERISRRSASNKVTLKQNKGSGFERSEDKKIYGKSVRMESSASNAVSDWLRIRRYGNLYQKLPGSKLKRFAFPLGEDAKERFLRAQVIRHMGTATSCIHFDVGYSHHFKEIFGSIINLDDQAFPEYDFEINIR